MGEAHLVNDLGGGMDVAQPPTGHSEGLGETVGGDNPVMHVREAPDGYVLPPAIDHLLVNLIRYDDEVVVDGQVRQGPELLPGIYRPSGVIGGVDHHHLGPGGDGGLGGLDVWVVVVRSDPDMDGFPVGDDDLGVVGGP